MRTTTIYRRVNVCMWGDGKFSGLSPIQPCGQALWLYLLTGPHTSPVPGVFVAGRAAMAEALGWELPDFDRAMKELLDAGMALYDPRTRLWFLPNAIRHNFPANPNVVRSWRAPLAIIPECELRDRILGELRHAMSNESDAWIQALDEALGVLPPRPSPNPSGKASPKALVTALPTPLAKASPRQEQEQEQEQEQREVEQKAENVLAEAPSVDPTSGYRRRPVPACPFDSIVASYHDTLPMLPRVRLLGKRRQQLMRTRWTWLFASKRGDGEPRAKTAEQALEWFRRYFKCASENDFVMGRVGRGKGHENWRADLDYLLEEKGLVQVIERTGAAS